MNEGELKKDEQVWYYKDNKEIVGPVSSYNMDKMVYFRTVNEDTKVYNYISNNGTLEGVYAFKTKRQLFQV